MMTISYEETAALLGVDIGTVKHAVGRGVFTRPPRVGRMQPLLREQVEIFKGKRLTLSALSNDERKKWYELDASVKTGLPVSPSQAIAPAAPAAPAITVNMDPDQFVKALLNNGLVSPGSSLNFHSALVDETGSKEEEAAASSGALFAAILLGLILLFLVLEERRKEARKQVERTLEHIGLETKDLTANPRHSIAILSSHPKDTQQIKRILVREDLLFAS
jgi:hypothetical protein